MSQPLLVDQIANALRGMNWNDQLAYSKRAEMICEAIGPAPAAAPEMLEALKKSADQIAFSLARLAELRDVPSHELAAYVERNSTLIAVRAAIAKAEGKQ